MQLVYGSRLTPFGGPHEASRGRLAIYQELFPELDDCEEKDVECRLFCPNDLLEALAQKTGLSVDPEERCLVFPGDTADLIKLVRPHFPDLELLNCDDDQVFGQLEAGR